MRFANVDGRSTIVTTDVAGVDVESVSRGRFGPDPEAVLADWEAFADWSAHTDLPTPEVALDRSRLGPPSPRPRQVVAVGLNYRSHAVESGFAVPERLPPVFTKFATALAGADTTVTLPAGGRTDWEVELVVVVGRSATAVAEEHAWEHVAGLTVGQDISERTTQLDGPAPQFSFGKSFAGFAPVGPWLVTPDELADPDDLELGCEVDGEEVQRGRTSDLIFSVPRLIADLSRAITLLPGDLIFTGTPSGVGMARDPQRFLQPGERLRSWIGGVGEIHQTFRAG